MATIATTFRLVDHVSSAMDRIRRSVNKTTQGFESFAGKLVSVNSALSLMGTAVRTVQSVGNFFGGFVKDASEYENILSSLKITLGDAGEAQAEFSRLQKLASETPFNLPDVAKASVVLRNVGVEAEKIIPTIRMLGDASLGDPAKFNAILQNYAQIQAIGKASEMDIKQFSNAMLPVRQIMKDMGITGQATSAQVEEMFRRMTSEGGKFYKGMETASKTLSGKLSTLKDDFKSLTSALGGSLLPTLKEVTGRISEMFKVIENSTPFRKLKESIHKMAWDIKQNLDTIIAVMIKMGTVATIVGTVMAGAWMVAHWPLTLIIIAITTIIRIMVDLTAQSNETSKEMTGSFNQVSEALSHLGAVFGGLKSIVGGTMNFIYNAVATVWNAVATVVEFGWNLFTGHWSVFGSFFIDLASTILDVISSITYAIDFMFGTSLTNGINNANKKMQEFKNTHFENTHKVKRLEMKTTEGFINSIQSGAETGAQAGAMVDPFLTFNDKYYAPDPWAGDHTPEKYKKYMQEHPYGELPVDANGNLKVAVQNEVRISDEYKQLLAQKAVEQYKIKYSQTVPQLSIENVNISNEMDVDSVINRFADDLTEIVSSDLSA